MVRKALFPHDRVQATLRRFLYLLFIKNYFKVQSIYLQFTLKKITVKFILLDTWKLFSKFSGNSDWELQTVCCCIAWASILDIPNAIIWFVHIPYSTYYFTKQLNLQKIFFRAEIMYIQASKKMSKEFTVLGTQLQRFLDFGPGFGELRSTVQFWYRKKGKKKPASDVWGKCSG